jgi:hypothetical protein
VIEMKLLERRMTLYEEKYGVPSEDSMPRLWRANWLTMIALCDDLLARADLPERLRQRVMEFAHTIRIRRDQWRKELISEAA